MSVLRGKKLENEGTLKLTQAPYDDEDGIAIILAGIIHGGLQ